MEKLIKAGFEQLHAEGAQAAGAYLREAIKAVDAEFGPGFAKNHPEMSTAIIGSYMAAAMTSYVIASQNKVLEGIAGHIVDSLNGVASSISEIAADLRPDSSEG